LTKRRVTPFLHRVEYCAVKRLGWCCRIGRPREIAGALRSCRPTELRALANETNTDADTRLHASLALLRTDASQLPYLKDRLRDAEPEQVDTIRLLLATHKDEIVDDLWHVVEEGKPNQLLRAASALAFYDADNDAKWLVVQKWLSILTTICPVDRTACVRGWTRLQPSAIFGAVQRSPLCWRND
jgi:hypothetical protein